MNKIVKVKLIEVRKRGRERERKIESKKRMMKEFVENK